MCACRIQLPSIGLDGVVDQSTRGSRGGELPVGIRRSRVFGVVAVPEGEVLSQRCEDVGLLLVIGLDDERSVAWGGIVFLRLPLNEAAHVGCIALGRIPCLVNLVARSREVVVWIYQRDLVLEWARAYRGGLIPDSPVRLSVAVA